jgi:phosphatidylglycerophosphate synthase
MYETRPPSLLSAARAITARGILATMLIAAPPGPIAASTFNSDLFIAVATLIPVLFLALVVQRDTFVRVLRAYQRFVNSPADEQPPSKLTKIPFVAGLVLVPLGLVGILVAGGWGEPLAIYASTSGKPFTPLSWRSFGRLYSSPSPRP